MTNQDHGTVGEAHRQTAMEILACPPDSPLWQDTEVYAPEGPSAWRTSSGNPPASGPA